MQTLLYLLSRYYSLLCFFLRKKKKEKKKALQNMALLHSTLAYITLPWL